MFEYMDSKYIKNNRQHDSTVTLIKSTVQQQVLDLITKESRESETSHDDLQKEADAEQLSQLPRKKMRLAEILKEPTASHKLRAEDVTTREWIISTFILLVLK